MGDISSGLAAIIGAIVGGAAALTGSIIQHGRERRAVEREKREEICRTMLNFVPTVLCICSASASATSFEDRDIKFSAEASELKAMILFHCPELYNQVDQFVSRIGDLAIGQATVSVEPNDEEKAKLGAYEVKQDELRVLHSKLSDLAMQIAKSSWT